jgi:ribose-phosphate pyrophosphokinase
MPNDLKIFSGSASAELTQEICKYLCMEMGKSTVGRFSDGEISVKLNENVRGSDLFVVNSTSRPQDSHLMELLMMVDAARRASAGRVTAVIPYYGYARQDRKDQPRVPITARLVANLITAAGAGRVLTIDLHADQIQGFFDIIVDHLYATPVLVDYARREGLDNLVIVAPDPGSVKRARDFANRLHAELVIVDKRRERANVSEVMNVIGDVEGRNAIVLDDMIDTAGTLVKAAQAVVDKGACSARACCTHPVFSGRAVENIEESCLEQVVVCNTIALSPDKLVPKIKVLSVARLLGEAIRRIHHGESVSSLFV